jgi:hypothetical protein
MDTLVKPAAPAPGVYQMDEAEYHASPGASKSALWTLHKRTPFHARYAPKVETNAQVFGSAAHCAVLEPGFFDARYYRGPADRRGNKWGAACEIAAQTGRECLTEKDYDAALRLRDVAQKNEIVRLLTKETPAIEQSAFWIDETTGELCRCRPDIFAHHCNVMADLKATTDAGLEWRRRIADFGYHVQDAFYRDGWTQAGGGKVDGFVFVVVEKDLPHAIACYELPQAAVELGRRIYRDALDRWHACRVNDVWPAYGNGVLEIDMAEWAYRQAEERLEA